MYICLLIYIFFLWCNQCNTDYPRYIIGSYGGGGGGGGASINSYYKLKRLVIKSDASPFKIRLTLFSESRQTLRRRLCPLSLQQCLNYTAADMLTYTNDMEIKA